MLRPALRSTGLDILPQLWNRYVRGPDLEQPKVLIDSSRVIALARCVIHFLPAMVSVAIITINLIGYYIGVELQGERNQDEVRFGLLQVAAKAHVSLKTLHIF